MRAMNRKKALAARLICSYRNRGRKVRTPYLVVLQKKKNTGKKETLHFDYIQMLEEEPDSALVKCLNGVLMIFRQTHFNSIILKVE